MKLTLQGPPLIWKTVILWDNIDSCTVNAYIPLAPLVTSEWIHS